MDFLITVSAKIALNALVYLYQKHLKKELGHLGFRYASKQRQLPSVLSTSQITQILNNLSGRNEVIIESLYGSGLRISECLRLRIQDIDLEHLSITVKDGKGHKDRQTILSHKCAIKRYDYINAARNIQIKENENGLGPSLPNALERKYPCALRNAGWMFIFPSMTTSKNPYTGTHCRHHLHQSLIRKALSAAVQKTNIVKRVTCHTFRHRFATHLLQVDEI